MSYILRTIVVLELVLQLRDTRLLSWIKQLLFMGTTKSSSTVSTRIFMRHVRREYLKITCNRKFLDSSLCEKRITGRIDIPGTLQCTALLCTLSLLTGFGCFLDTLEEWDGQHGKGDAVDTTPSSGFNNWVQFYIRDLISCPHAPWDLSDWPFHLMSSWRLFCWCVNFPLVPSLEWTCSSLSKPSRASDITLDLKSWFSCPGSFSSTQTWVLLWYGLI